MSANIGFSLNVINRNVPLDPRVVVEDTDGLETLSSYYKGMAVVSKDTNRVYILNVEPTGTPLLTDWTSSPLNADDITSGTLDNARLPSAITLDSLSARSIPLPPGDTNITYLSDIHTFTSYSSPPTTLATLSDTGLDLNGGDIIAEYMYGTNPTIQSTTLNNYFQMNTDGTNIHEAIKSYFSDLDGTGIKVTIDSKNGRVGIGSTKNNPTQALEVDGTTLLGGDITAGGNITYNNFANQLYIERINFNSRASITWTYYGAGILYQGADSFIWRNKDNTSGETLMNLNSSTGNLGIGTPSPSEKLEVNGNIKATGFNGSGSGITALNASQITSGTLSNDKLPADITLTGNITANQASVNSLKLRDGNLEILSSGGDVKGRIEQIDNDGVNFQGHRVTATDNAGTTRLKLDGVTSTISLGQNDKWTLKADDSLNLQLTHYSDSNNTEFLIKNNFPGTTTTNGEAILHLSTSSQSKDSIIYLGTPNDSTSPPKCAIIAKALNDWSKADLMFCVNNADNNTDKVDKDDARMIVSSDKVDVKGDILCNSNGFMGGRGTSTAPAGALSFRPGGTSDSTISRIVPANYNGSFSTLTGKVELGNINLRFRNIYLTFSPNVGSDDRLKHNEEPVVDALGTINKLKLYKYDKTIEMLDADFNGDLGDIDHHKEIGFIAQEVKEIPELAFLVSGGGTETYGLNYQGLNNIAIQAIQELSAEVTRLRRLVEGTPQTAS